MIDLLGAATAILALLWLLAFVMVGDLIVWFENQLNFAPWASFVRRHRRAKWNEKL